MAYPILPLLPPTLFLLGPSGVGKSTVGPLLAQKLKIPSIDTDSWIENDTGLSVAEIFKERGEAYFRVLEKALLLEGLPPGPLVVACGGGAVTIPGLHEALTSKGLVVVLEAKLDSLTSRLKTTLSHRPLLSGGTLGVSLKEKLYQQLSERQPLYEQISYRIPTDSLTPEEVTDQILNLYSPYCHLVRI